MTHTVDRSRVQGERARPGVLLWVAALVLAFPVLPAEPPPLLNYQGVLRDAADAPLDGSHDMVFRFWSGETGGDEILIDAHDSAHGNPVIVSGGLFNVELGSGVVSDGSGPGAFVTLAHVFRDYGDLWLEIAIDGETLSPRVRVVSAGYAINADHLDGVNSTKFLRSDTSDSFTFGTLTVMGGTALQVDGDLQMNGSVSKATTDLVANFNADLLDGLHSSEFAGASHGHPGSDITGPVSEASNADTLDGHDSSFFVNTSSAAQTKTGPLTMDASTVPGEYGVRGYGLLGGGYFQDSDSSGNVIVAAGGIGIQAKGNTQGGYFEDLDGSGLAYVANNDTGIEGYGNALGGFFQDLDHSGYAEVGSVDVGIRAYGNESGGYFKDRDGSSYSYIGTDDCGIEAVGRVAGGEFTEIGGSGSATLANADVGIRSVGDAAGGFFRDSNGTGYTNVAEGDYGIHALGSAAGGWFEDSDSYGSAYLGYGGYGIEAHGFPTAGLFTNIISGTSVEIGQADFGMWVTAPDLGGRFEATCCGPTVAMIAATDKGIDAVGTYMGGHFDDSDNSGHAHIAVGDEGVKGWGNVAGGYFVDSDSSGEAYVGQGDFGIGASGTEAGGYFQDSDGSSIVWVGRNDNGISSYGNLMGGYFEDPDNGTAARIAYGEFGIDSNGTKNFVQNHPYDDGKVIAYSSLEGDEAGTYTRGTARLENGVARVPLGETFRWVTNPDIGLTVHLTPVGEWSDLYVIEKSTEEIVVGSHAGVLDAAFDYIVFGLRIGFEETQTVREKDGEAFIPSMASVHRRYEESPELRGFNALERFKRMAAAVQGVEGYEPDFDASRALRTAIQEYDPIVHGPLSERQAPDGERSVNVAPREEKQSAGVIAEEADRWNEATEATAWVSPADEPSLDLPDGATLFPVLEPVEPGDLLVLDLEHPGQLRRAAAPSDPTVIGVVAAEPIGSDGLLQAPVMGTGFSVVKVDAGYGAVRAGDLLVSSPTPGCAMATLEPTPGAIVGKALEPLEQGIGLIRVLVNIR